MFTGLVDTDKYLLYSHDTILDNVPNDVVAIYNFETKLWHQQSSLPFGLKFGEYSYGYDSACVIYHEKSKSRFELFVHLDKCPEICQN